MTISRHFPFLALLLAFLLHGLDTPIAPGVQRADPVTLVVAAVVLVAGSIFYSRQQAAAMAKKAKRDRDKNAGTLITSREPAAQRRIIYGRRRVGGIYTFIHSTDSVGGLKNEYLHLVIALAGHEVNDIGDIYFDEKLVPLDGSGNCVSGPFSGLVRVKKYLGTDSQTADADLMAEASDKWTSNHRLRGIAYLYVRLKYDQNQLANIPNISAVVEGRKLYDPRTGLTTYSANPALAIRDYLTNTDYGLGTAADELTEASFITAASLCDEAVALAAGGTEPRYTVNGVVERDSTPADVLSDLSASMSAAVVCSGGTWSIIGGAYNAPSQTITLNDLRGQINIQTKDSRRDTANAIKGTYISEANKWQPADYPPVKNATYFTQDGERIWRELSLPFTTSAATAQRLAKIELEQARQEISLTLPLKLIGLRLQAGEVVNLTIARYGWTAKPFEIVGWKLVIEDGVGEGGGKIVGVDVSLRETAAGVWDWNSGLETTVDLAPNTTLPDPATVVAPTSLVATSSAQINADGSVSGRLDVTWIPALDVFASSSSGTLQVQYKLAAAADWITHANLAGDADRTTISGLVSGQSYLVRIRAIRNGGAASAWVTTGSSIVAAGDTTAPGVPTGLVVSAMVQGIRLSWVNPTAADLANIEVLEQSAATPTPGGGTTPSFRLLSDTFTRVGLAIGATRYYWVRAVDASGNASAWAGPVSATANAVDVSWINGQLQDSQIAALAASKITGQLTDAQIAALAAAKLTGQITQTQITDNSISTSKLAAAAITSDKIASDSVLADKIASNAITAVKIQAGAIETAKLAAFAVDAGKIAAGAIVADKIAANAITADKVGANQIITATANIGDGVIATAKIGDAQITTLKVVGNAITHPFVSNQSGIAYLNDTSFVTLASVAGVAASGSSVVVTISVSLTNNSSASRDFILETLRDGTVLDSVTHRLPANYDTVMTRMMLDSGASGTHTYSAQVRVTTAPGTSNTVWAEKGVIQPSIYKR